MGPVGKTRPSPNGHSSLRVSPSTTTTESAFFTDGLVAVVHDDGLRAGLGRRLAPAARSRATQTGKSWRASRLVADVGAGVDCWIDPHRTLQPSAVSPQSR